MTLSAKKCGEDWGPSYGAIEAVVRGEHGDPFSILGLHREHATSIRAFLPGAKAVAAIHPETGDAIALSELHPSRFFGGEVPTTMPRKYRLRVTYDAQTVEIEDPYRFGQ
jgi:1,4-alpha-glucan branching enzyme